MVTVHEGTLQTFFGTIGFIPGYQGLEASQCAVQGLLTGARVPGNYLIPEIKETVGGACVIGLGMDGDMVTLTWKTPHAGYTLCTAVFTSEVFVTDVSGL